MSSLLHDLYQTREALFSGQKSPQKEISPRQNGLFYFPYGGHCFLAYISALQEVLMFMPMHISTSESQTSHSPLPR